MYAIDFEYDGQLLSDYGFIICDFNGASVNTISAGSVISFNKVSMHSGKKYALTSTTYGECIQTTFSICKKPSTNKDMTISNDEYRDLFRWLNRREFLKFRLVLCDEEDVCYYNASFNISKIEIGNVFYGLELTMETDKPFGYSEKQKYVWNVTNTNDIYILPDTSDEIGSTYVSMKITINENGNFILSNEMENCEMVINNCVTGEVITIDGDTQIITTSLDSHKIYNDFNFEFFRIGNSFSGRENKLTCNLESEIIFEYSPIVKDGF